MQIYFNRRWMLILLLLLSACLLVTHGRGGRGGGGRGGGSRGGGSRGRIPSGRSRPTYRPAPAPRPSPRPAPKPSPNPAPKPTARPQPPSPRPPAASPRPPAASPKPSAPDEAVVARQPSSNPNFKETNAAQGSADRQPASNPNFKETNAAPGSADRQPASNPNYKPDGGAPGGPPPPYSPQGQPAPPAGGGAPPPYQPNAPPGQRYPQQPGAQPPPYPAQPPPYSGPPGRPPAYPGQSPPYPVQPGAQPYPQQPGSYPRQPGYPGSYPQQPGSPGSYPQQPGMNRPYPVQPGYPQQPGMNRPYPVQPGGYSGGSRPNPQQPLGGNVWQPQSGMPAPAYMNYGGIPTGANMYSKPHKQKGFMGSLMSMGSGRPNIGKQNKYYGSYPSPYGAGRMGGGMMGGGMMGAGMMGGAMMGGGMGRMGGGGSFLRTAAMYTILPYMAYRVGSSLFRPSYMFMPSFMPYHHHHYGQGMHGSSNYYDVYNNDYVGKCMRPLKKEHLDIRCKTTYDDIKCDAKCEDDYEFPDNITLITNRCWHAAGIWRPQKNFPDCKPVCNNDCLNGGECIRPGECKCPAEFRGSLCQFRKSNFLNCDVRNITKGEMNVGWVCNHFKNETVCKIRCKEPALFESPTSEEFRCSAEGKWTPEKIPHCILKEKEGVNSTSVK